MSGNQKIVVVLLILAILFSAVSIFISFSALNIDLPERGLSGQVSGVLGSGGISLSVEIPPGSVGR